LSVANDDQLAAVCSVNPGGCVNAFGYLVTERLELQQKIEALYANDQIPLDMKADLHRYNMQNIAAVGQLIKASKTLDLESMGISAEKANWGATLAAAIVGVALGNKGGAAKGTVIPKGFSSADDFARFGADARDGLARAGYGNAEPILQGSAVTGQSFKTGQAFDVGRVSDFDIALASPELLQRAQSLGIGLRSGGTRTGPLSARDLQALGLKDLASKLSSQAGREVNFMIYDSAATASSRAPSVALPK
jgi:hypothetical protein